MSANLKPTQSELPEFKLLINGKLVPRVNDGVINRPRASRSSSVRAPTSRLNELSQPESSIPGLVAQDVGRAQKLVLALADALTKHQDELARLLTLEQGKPLMHAQFEIGGSIAMLRRSRG